MICKICSKESSDKVFKAKEIAENVGALSHTAFFDPAKTGSGVSTKPKKQAKSKK